MKAKPSLKAVTNQNTQNLLFLQAIGQVMQGRGFGRLGQQYQGKRNLYNVLGYSVTPTIDDYWQYFLREDLCKRVVIAPVKATWRCPPEIYESDNPDRETEFEKAWDVLAKQLQVWSYFARADKLAGVGNYGVMLLGVKGKLDTPVQVPLKNSKLLFLSTYSQRHATVSEYETDTQSERYGKPKYYEVDLSGDLGGLNSRTDKTSKRAKSSSTQTVHYSRILHLAEELLEDEVHGTPRLEAVFNRMYDLQKVVGCSAEGYWRSAYGGFALEAVNDATSAFQGTGVIDTDKVDEFSHGMRRWIELEGYKLNRIEGQDFKPKEVFDVIIALVSAATGIPQRILLGSERGQLASSQDETNWKDYIEERRTEYAEPLIRNFIDRLIVWGLLPKPKVDYRVEWPSLYTLDDKEKAEIFAKYAEGVAKIAPGGQTELIVTPKEIRTEWLGFEAEPEDTLALDTQALIPPLDG